MQKLIALITGLLTAVSVPLAMAATDTTALDDSVESDQSMETTADQPEVTDLGFMSTFFEGTPESDMTRAFDLTRFRAHPCFVAVGEELDYCLAEFGVRSDFQTLLQDESFARLILQYTLQQYCEGLTGDALQDCARENASFLPQVLSDIDEEPDVGTDDTTDDSDETNDEGLTSRQRSQLLWEHCAQADMGQALCYQQFLRAVTDETVDMSEVASVIDSL